MLRHILTPIGWLYKVDHRSEEVCKGLFARVCVELDISKPFKLKIKYIRDGILYECFLDYENITNICHGCGSQAHKFDSYVFKSKHLVFKVKNLQEMLQVDDSFVLKMEGKTTSHDAEWVEVRPYAGK